MLRFYEIALTFAVLACLSIPASLAGPALLVVPPDSFIKQHVDTVPQLTQQVTMDPVVRRRLARHFHTSGPAVVRYIQDNLVLKHITVAKRYQVYCIARDGHEYLISSRLAVGTPVFVLRNTDRPILKLACGNPMVAAFPWVKPATGGYSTPKLAGLPSGGTGTLTPSLKPNGPVVLTLVPSAGVPVAAPVSPYFGSTGGLPVHGGGNGLGYLLGAPVLYGVLHHGGSSGGNTGTGSANNSSTGNNSGGTTGSNTGTGTATGTGNNSGGTTGNDTGTGTTGGTGTGNNNLGTTDNNSGGSTGSSTGSSTGTGTGTGVAPVPEPAAPAAFLVGGAGLVLLLAGARRRGRRIKH